MAEKSHSTFTICNSLCKQIGPIKKGFPATKKEVWESSSNTKSRQFPPINLYKIFGFWKRRYVSYTVVWTAIDSIAEIFFFSTATSLHGAFASECSGLCFNY